MNLTHKKKIESIYYRIRELSFLVLAATLQKSIDLFQLL